MQLFTTEGFPTLFDVLRSALPYVQDRCIQLRIPSTDAMFLGEEACFLVLPHQCLPKPAYRSAPNEMLHELNQVRTFGQATTNRQVVERFLMALLAGNSPDSNLQQRFRCGKGSGKGLYHVHFQGEITGDQLFANFTFLDSFRLCLTPAENEWTSTNQETSSSGSSFSHRAKPEPRHFHISLNPCDRLGKDVPLEFFPANITLPVTSLMDALDASCIWFDEKHIIIAQNVPAVYTLGQFTQAACERRRCVERGCKGEETSDSDQGNFPRNVMNLPAGAATIQRPYTSEEKRIQQQKRKLRQKTAVLLERRMQQQQTSAPKMDPPIKSNLCRYKSSSHSSKRWRWQPYAPHPDNTQVECNPEIPLPKVSRHRPQVLVETTHVTFGDHFESGEDDDDDDLTGRPSPHRKHSKQVISPCLTKAEQQLLLSVNSLKLLRRGASNGGFGRGSSHALSSCASGVGLLSRLRRLDSQLSSTHSPSRGGSFSVFNQTSVMSLTAGDHHHAQ